MPWRALLSKYNLMLFWWTTLVLNRPKALSLTRIISLPVSVQCNRQSRWLFSFDPASACSKAAPSIGFVLLLQINFLIFVFHRGKSLGWFNDCALSRRSSTGSKCFRWTFRFLMTSRLFFRKSFHVCETKKGTSIFFLPASFDTV